LVEGVHAAQSFPQEELPMGFSLAEPQSQAGLNPKSFLLVNYSFFS
jgi:hypothetical protein